MKFKYLEKWNNGRTFHQPGSPLGDESKRFRLEDGREGKVEVYELSGGWMYRVEVEGQTVKSTRSWGARSKAKAKSLAVSVLRDWAEVA